MTYLSVATACGPFFLGLLLKYHVHDFYSATSFPKQIELSDFVSQKISPMTLSVKLFCLRRVISFTVDLYES